MLNKLFLNTMVLALTFFAITSVYGSDTPYKLAAGDSITIKVYGEEDLSIEELKIDNRETLDFPYLGTLQLGGKTLAQLQDEITKGLKGRVLVNPKVNVAIVQYRSVYVNGMVNKPGAYEYEPDLTVQEAISLAGGILTKYRRSAKIYLIPEGRDKGLSLEELENAFEDDTQQEANPYQKVRPGDTLYVAASFW